jgi:argininosuccinate synthase
MEFLTVQKDVLEFKRSVEQKYSELAYNGLWFGVLRESLDKFIDETQKYVTGTIRMKLFKGSATVVGRKSEYSLYDEGLSTYAKGDVFDHTSAVGFIYCWGLPNKTTSKAHMKKSKK